MATEAYTLQLIYYQLQQETAYYIAELDPVKKEQHRKNIVNLYALLTRILSPKSPKIKPFYLPPPPPPPPSATV